MGENQSIDYQPKYPPKIAISEPTGRSILQKSSIPIPDFPKTVSFNPIVYTTRTVEHNEESQMSKKVKPEDLSQLEQNLKQKVNRDFSLLENRINTESSRIESKLHKTVSRLLPDPNESKRFANKVTDIESKVQGILYRDNLDRFNKSIDTMNQHHHRYNLRNKNASHPGAQGGQYSYSSDPATSMGLPPVKKIPDLSKLTLNSRFQNTQIPRPLPTSQYLQSTAVPRTAGDIDGASGIVSGTPTIPPAAPGIKKESGTTGAVPKQQHNVESYPEVGRMASLGAGSVPPARSHGTATGNLINLGNDPEFLENDEAAATVLSDPGQPSQVNNEKVDRSRLFVSTDCLISPHTARKEQVAEEDNLARIEPRPPIEEVQRVALRYLKGEVHDGQIKYGTGGFADTELRRKYRLEIVLHRFMENLISIKERGEMSFDTANEYLDKVSDAHERWRNSSEWVYGIFSDFIKVDPVIAEAAERIQNEFHILNETLMGVIQWLNDFIVASSYPERKDEPEETLTDQFHNQPKHSSPNSTADMVTARELDWSMSPPSEQVSDPEVRTPPPRPVVPQPMANVEPKNPAFSPMMETPLGMSGDHFPGIRSGIPQPVIGIPKQQEARSKYPPSVTGSASPGVMRHPSVSNLRSLRPAVNPVRQGNPMDYSHLSVPGQHTHGIARPQPQHTYPDQVGPLGGYRGVESSVQHGLGQTGNVQPMGQPVSMTGIRWENHPVSQGLNTAGNWYNQQQQQLHGQPLGSIHPTNSVPEMFQPPNFQTQPDSETSMNYWSLLVQSMSPDARRLMEHFDRSGRVLREPPRDRGSFKKKLSLNSQASEIAMFWAKFSENYEFVKSAWLNKVTELEDKIDQDLKSTLSSFQIQSGLHLPYDQIEMHYKVMYFKIKAKLMERTGITFEISIEDQIKNLPILKSPSDLVAFQAFEDLLQTIEGNELWEMNSPKSAYLKPIHRKISNDMKVTIVEFFDRHQLVDCLSSLKVFVERRTKILHDIRKLHPPKSKQPPKKDDKGPQPTKVQSFATNVAPVVPSVAPAVPPKVTPSAESTKPAESKPQNKCPSCSQPSHNLKDCPNFVKASPEAKSALIKKHKHCFHCLKRAHRNRCPSYKRCETCGYGHHPSLRCAKPEDFRKPNTSESGDRKPQASSEGGKPLEVKSHFVVAEVETAPTPPANSNSDAEPQGTRNFDRSRTFEYTPFLAHVFVRNRKTGIAVPTIAMIDNGTGTSVFHRPLADAIGLEGEEKMVWLSTLNKRELTKGIQSDDLVIEAIDGSYQGPLNCIALNHRPDCKMIETVQFRRKYRYLNDIYFPEGPATEVGLLLGRDNMHLISPLETRQGKIGQPMALRFPFAWILSVPADNPVGVTSYATIVESADGSNPAETFHEPVPKVPPDIVSLSEEGSSDESSGESSTKGQRCDQDTCPHNLLQDMANIESIGVFEKEAKFSPRQEETLRKMKASLKINENQLVEIEIPLNDKVSELVNNFEKVLVRQKLLEKKLIRLQIYELYWSLLVEAMRKGYIKQIDDPFPAKGFKFYVPNFYVLKPESLTTPVRLVFDAKAHCGSHLSFNDTVEEAPDLQNLLSDILLDFRKESIGWTCDVRQMFSQVAIPEHQHDLQRFVFRPPGSDEFKVFAHKRWWMGNKAAPAAAQLALIETAESMKEEVPLGAKIVKKGRYMDDTCVSSKNLEEAVRGVKQSIKIYDVCRMDTQKFISNSKDLMGFVAPEQRLKDYVSGDLPKTKVLGYPWDPNSDTLSIQPVDHSKVPTTKRGLLHELASVYDPLGFVAPFTVSSRMLLQRCWNIMNLEWDSLLPPDIQGDTTKWHNQLDDLPNVKIPRQAISEPVQAIHIFCDSSEYAYGVAAYGVGSTQSGLLMSKGRVHPKRPNSIPRKELQACVLGAKVANTLAKAYPGVPIRLWTDSYNCVCWIRNDSRRYKQYVGNRVALIQELTDPLCWNWVSTDSNPADLVSRGANLPDLIGNDFWLSGPKFLCDETLWPEAKSYGTPTEETKKEGYKEIFSLLVGVGNCLNFKDYDSLSELVKAQVQKNRNSAGLDLNSPIMVDEQNDALADLIKLAQAEGFPDELESLRADERIKRSSSVFKLCPLLDEKGVLRLKTRLEKATNLPYDLRFPILLPRDHQLTKLIILDIHDSVHHAYGSNYMLSVLREKYWVPKGLSVVKKVRAGCKECQKVHGKPQIPQMAPLPPYRVDEPLCAFDEVGFDFTGHFLTMQGRGQKRVKRYAMIFTCMHTRAIHVEMAASLDTSDCLQCIVRFISRRGKPKNFYSDRGTNFIGASREMRQLVSEIDDAALQEEARRRGFNIIFNPPHSPHMGGVWESMVKSFKRAVYAIVPSRDLTDLELETVFIQAEDIVNSRPLAFLNSDPNDFNVLTPNCFLTSRLHNQVFPDNIDTQPFDVRCRWKYVQRAARDIWKRWIREILPTIGKRGKWINDGREYQVGDSVLIMDPDLPRYKWQPGRITEVSHGRDNRVRVVKIRTEDGERESNVHRLIPLV